MSNRRGLPTTARMRHDSHFVEELAASQTNAIGQMLPIDQLRPNPSQPRRLFEGLDELVASIQQACFWHLEAPIERVAGWDTPYPHAFEWQYFPGQKRMAASIRRVMEAG